MPQNGDPKAARPKLQVPAKARGRGRNPDPAGRAKSHLDHEYAHLVIIPMTSRVIINQKS
jgi:hypothetical protein